jgi:hypothetical protein
MGIYKINEIDLHWGIKNSMTAILQIPVWTGTVLKLKKRHNFYFTGLFLFSFQEKILMGVGRVLSYPEALNLFESSSCQSEQEKF